MHSRSQNWGLQLEMLTFFFNSSLLSPETEEKCHHSKLSNNTLLLLSAHPLYFTPHTSEAILSTHCHTSTGSVRYLLRPAALLKPSCGISTFLLICSILRVCIVLKPYVSAAHKKRKQAVAPKSSLHLYRIHAELSFVCKTPLSNLPYAHPSVCHLLNLHLL